jgi:hypothetical protein
MNSLVPVCFPSSDVRFGEQVRSFVHRERWHLDGAEGVALLQALLRTSYPMASVSSHEQVLSRDGHTVTVTEAYRDRAARAAQGR